MRAHSIPLWKSAPFVRLFALFTVGILSQHYATVPVFAWMIAGGVLLFLLSIFPILPFRFIYRLAKLRAFIFSACVLVAGALITRLADVRSSANWYGHNCNDSSVLMIRVLEPPVKKERSFRLVADVEMIYNETAVVKTKGTIYCYLSADQAAQLPEYGDRLLIRNKLQEIRNSGNPGAFDYKQYAAFQNVFHSVFLKKESVELLSSYRRSPLFSAVFATREYIVKAIQKYTGPGKEVSGLIEALLIGYKQDLDADLVADYTTTGVVHIIAISGMHLGLIYFGLLWLLARIPLVKKNKVLQVILIISILWCFSLLTGASASVLRSAVMFTCVIIGRNFFGKAGVFNALAASAFLLLCHNPFLLWDAGFQLSYLAVVGIVWLQKIILNLFYIKNPWLQKLWQACAVTIAAQIFTTPVCLYYFHQFPNLFLITNLIALPLSTAVLFCGMFTVSFSFYPSLASALGKLSYVLTRLMNECISLCATIPYARTENISFPYPAALVSYLLIALLFLWAKFKKKLRWILVSACLGLICVIIGMDHWRAVNQKSIVIYNISKHTLIDLTDGKKLTTVGDTAIERDKKIFRFNQQPARIEMHTAAAKPTYLPQFPSNQLISFGSKRIMICRAALTEQEAGSLSGTILVLTANCKAKLDEIPAAAAPVMIVIDASNSLWKTEQFRKECDRLNLPCHITGEQGAFIADAR